MASLSVVFDLIAKDNASKEIDKVGDASVRSTGKFDKFGKAAALGAAAVAGAAIKVGTDSVKAYVEAEQSATRLDAAYAKFPKTNDVARSSFDKLNESLAKKTRFDDDATASGQAVLAQFGLTGKQIQDLTPLLQDYAAKTGKSLPDAAAALGKATLGQGRALKEVGINFKDTKDAGQNFEQIMGGLRTQVGGFAETEGKTAAGTADIMKNRLGEVQETIGSKLVPVLKTMADKLLEVIGFVERNSAVIGPLAAGIAALAGAVIAVNAAAKVYAATQAALNVVMAANPIGLVIIAIAGLVAGLVIAYKKSETFRDIVDGAFAKVKAAGQGIADFVTKTIPAAFETVRAKAGDAMTKMKDALSATWTAIKNAIPAAWEAIKGAVVTAFTTVVQYLASLPQAVVDTVQTIWTAVKNAVAGAWNLIRDALGVAFTALLNYIKGYPANFVANMQLIWSAVRDAVPAAFALIRDKIGAAFTGKGGILEKVKGFGGDVVEAIVKGVKGAGSLLEDAVKGLLNKLPGIDFKIDGKGGDGVGIGGEGGQPQGVQAQMAAVRRAFPGTPLISGFRPGAVTPFGNESYHAKGRAVDLPPSMAIFNYLRSNFGKYSKELFFSPADSAGLNIRNGKSGYRLKPQTYRDHQDHIHWAMHQGGQVGAGIPRSSGDSGTERTIRAQVGEVITTQADMGDVLAELRAMRSALERMPRQYQLAARTV